MRTSKELTPALFLAGCCAALVFVLASAVGAEETSGDEAEQLFVETYKCVRCHGVASAGLEATSEKMKSTDLGGYTSDDMATLTKFLRKEELKEDGTKHKKTFDGSDEDLATILDWLGTLEASSLESAPEDG